MDGSTDTADAPTVALVRDTEPARPPGKDPDAPFGRDAAGQAKAPYGLRKDGKPRLQGGGKRAGSGPNRSGPSAPGRAPGTRAAPPAVDYRPGIKGLIQLPAAALAFAGPTGQLDSWALTHYGPGIADGLNELAKIRPEVAALLDRVVSMGPYGLVLGPVLMLAVQLLMNHELIPIEIGKLAGGKTRDEIAADLLAKAPPRAA